jgi:cytochrome P450
MIIEKLLIFFLLGKHWHTMRKLLTPSFHFRVLEKFIHVINEQTAILMNIINEKVKVKEGKEFDMAPLIMHATLDIICGTKNTSLPLEICMLHKLLRLNTRY